MESKTLVILVENFKEYCILTLYQVKRIERLVEIYAGHIWDKKFTSRAYKELMEINKQKILFFLKKAQFIWEGNSQKKKSD